MGSSTISMLTLGISYIILLPLAVLVGYLGAKKINAMKTANAEESAKKIIADAEKTVEAKKKEAILEAKEMLYKTKA